MDNRWKTETQGKGGKTMTWRGGSVSFLSLAFLVCFFCIFIYLHSLSDSCSLVMQWNPAMRLADQSRIKPAVAIQGQQWRGRGVARGSIKAAGSEQILESERNSTLTHGHSVQRPFELGSFFIYIKKQSFLVWLRHRPAKKDQIRVRLPLIYPSLLCLWVGEGASSPTQHTRKHTIIRFQLKFKNTSCNVDMGLQGAFPSLQYA